MFRQVFLCVEETFPPPSKRDEGRAGQALQRHTGPPLRPCEGVTAGTPPILKGRLAGLVARRLTVRGDAAKPASPPRGRGRQAQLQHEPILDRTEDAE